MSPTVQPLPDSKDQCSHAFEHVPNTTIAQWRSASAAERQRTPQRCLRTVTHTVDGRGHCALHAGAILLAAVADQPAHSKESTMTNDQPATDAPDLSKMTAAGRLRHEVAQHIDTHNANLRLTALKLAVEVLGQNNDDGSGIITLADAFLTFLTAGQKLTDR